MPESPLFKFTQDGDRWECQPSGTWGQFGFVFFLFGATFLLYISGQFFWTLGDSFAGFGFGTVLLLAAGLLTWTASRYWRLRHVPLTVTGTGRVSYGPHELCPSGSVRGVRIVPDPHAESGDCKVVLERADGSRVELPGPFFGAVSQREAARRLAGELAKALKMAMVETA
jgi:hypothetical protein